MIEHFPPFQLLFVYLRLGRPLTSRGVHFTQVVQQATDREAPCRVSVRRVLNNINLIRILLIYELSNYKSCISF